MSTLVSINGLDKRKLAYFVWENTTYAAFFRVEPSAPKPTLNDEAINKGVLNHPFGGVDYLAGKLWRLGTFSEDTVDASLYDRDIGTGAFALLVERFRDGEAKTDAAKTEE